MIASAAEISDVRPARWFRLGVGGLVIVLVYAPIFPSLVSEWREFPSLSHGFAIPLIAAYFVWAQRRRLAALDVAPSWSGLPVVVGGLAMYATATLGGETFLARLSLPLTLVGAVLLLAGRRMARVVAPAIAYLIFMIPLPYVPMKFVAEQSRLFDATVTANILPWVGIPVYQTGFLLHLPNITLEVADVCSSVPGTLSLLALAAVYGSVSQAPGAIRLTLFVLAVPLGIGSNIIRIIVSAISAYHFGPIALNNVVHKSNGLTVFLMTFAALMVCDTGLRRLRGNVNPQSPIVVPRSAIAPSASSVVAPHDGG